MDQPKSTVIQGLQHRGDEPHLLREIFKSHQVLMSGFARKTGMAASRFALMRLLSGSERDIGITDLARQLGINAAAVTRQVQELEREGLIRRRADRRDGRRSYVRLSSNGRRLFEKIHERAHELEQSLESVIGADEMRDAAVVLMRLQAVVESRLGGESR
jgi:DNA-binding MarR family transcriptional regulator